MASLNKMLCIGRLGQDPDVRYTQSGDPVANFSVAMSETWKDKNGEKRERTEWISAVVWGKLAEVCKRYLAKGAQVYLEGRLQTRKWTGDDGIEKRKTEIVVQNMVMLGGKRQAADAGNPGYSENEPAPAAGESSGGDPGIGDDDVPF